MQSGPSPLKLPPKIEESGKAGSNPFTFVARLLLGTAAGGYYFLLPIYMWLKNLIWPRSLPGF